MSKKCEIKSYIKNITNDENVREQLNNVHNEIFDKLHKSKLFDMWNQILFEHSNNISKINDGRRLVGAINSEYGTPVVGWTKTPTNRQHVYVNVKNLLPKYTNNPNQRKLFSLKENDVNQGIKAIDILQSDKAKQIFDKGEKNKWDLNKILTELAISKYQKELILGLNKTNREEIVTDLLANYSYTIEINTAKDKTDYRFKDNAELADYGGNSGYEDFEYEGSKYTQRTELEFDGEEHTYFYKDDKKITKREFNETAKKLLPKIIDRNSSHYSNLTVPGGTNYTENEIATPQIVPSIKGHAQFATDNGIGWFRSDDKENKVVGWKEEDDFLNSETAQYNPITKNDKVIFGHPTIGKSYLKQKGSNDFITLDDDYADEVNAFIDKNRGSETRQEYKGRKPKEYNQFMLNLFDRLKVQAKKEGKRLFVSNTNILKERMSEFDKVITIPKDEFKKRFDARGATYGFEDWKSDIDATVAKVDKSKVISTTGYLSDLLKGNPKTRRILEVQSDLYQKGRNLGDIEQIIKDLQKSGDLKIDCN